MRTLIRWMMLILPLLAGAGSPACARQQEADAKAEVPALTAFHEVVFELWHDAWPNKDAAKLTALAPRVASGIQAVASSTLPGILHEKQESWDAGVAALKNAGLEYQAAVRNGAPQPLLDAAEKVHKAYEQLVRSIHPVVREMEEFHSELYVLYHVVLPADSVAGMRKAAPVLQKKMAALNKAALPEKLRAKDARFKSARKALLDAVEAYGVVAERGDEKKLRAAIERVHTEYQRLEQSLE